MPWQLSPTKAHVKALDFHEGTTSLSGGVDGEALGFSASSLALLADGHRERKMVPLEFMCWVIAYLS